MTPDLHATLAFIIDSANPKKVLLGLKKRGYGKDKWNGFGGKPDLDEPILQTAIREVREECGLEISESLLTKTGELTFKTEGGKPDLHVHVFVTDAWKGEPFETEEMNPAWFEYEKIPFHKMWPDEKLWLPMVLSGEHIEATFWFDESEKKLLKSEIRQNPPRWNFNRH